MTGKQKAEILPPDTRQKRKKAKSLSTMGDIRREMASTYSAYRAGQIPIDILTREVYALRTIGQQIEAIEKLGLDTQDDEDTREQFVGMKIVAPRLVADNTKPTTEGKSNGKSHTKP